MTDNQSTTQEEQKTASEETKKPAESHATVARKKRLQQEQKEREDRSDWQAKYEHDRTIKKTFRLRVVYNRNGCIGSSHCILSDPYNFELDEHTKAILKDGEEMPNSPGVFIKVVETDEPHLVLNAAKTCTPRVISVIDMDTGKRIAP